MEKERGEPANKDNNTRDELSSVRGPVNPVSQNQLVEIPILDFDAIPVLAAQLAGTVEQRPYPEHGFFVKGTDTPYSGVYYWVNRSRGRELYNVANVKNGQLEGNATTYRPDGSKAGKIKFRDGKPLEGSERYWNRKGEEVGTREESEN